MVGARRPAAFAFDLYESAAREPHSSCLPVSKRVKREIAVREVDIIDFSVKEATKWSLEKMKLDFLLL